MREIVFDTETTGLDCRVERIIAHQWGHYDPKDTQTQEDYAKRERQTFQAFFQNLEEEFRKAASHNQQQQQQQQREFYEQFYGRQQQRQQQQQEYSYSRRGPSGSSRGSSSGDAQTKDPYSVLGVSRSASDDELRQAFRKKLLMYHPDHYQGSEGPEFAKQMTQEVVQAYRSLKKK